MTEPPSLQGIAGLVVRSHPADLDDVLQAMAAFADIDVHHVEADQGRAVLTLEVTSTDAAESRLRALRALPGVLTVDLVLHHRIERET